MTSGSGRPAGWASEAAVVPIERRVAGHIRVALEVDDTPATAAVAGAQVLAEPTVTPWRSLNARVQTPEGRQLTLLFVEPPQDGQESDAQPDGQPGDGGCLKPDLCVR
jgi:lactoylglutathione lyase